MRTTILRVSLGVVGAALLVLGALQVAADVRDYLHTFGSLGSGGFSLIVRLHWVAISMVGTAALALSLRGPRRKLRE